MAGRSSPSPLEDWQQAPLFDSERIVERTMSTGTTIRTLLRPAGGGRVTIVAYYRRAGTGRWVRRPMEERTVEFESLGLASSYDELFGPDL